MSEWVFLYNDAMNMIILQVFFRNTVNQFGTIRIRIEGGQTKCGEDTARIGWQEQIARRAGISTTRIDYCDNGEVGSIPQSAAYLLLFRVRRELEGEFAKEIEKVKKEFQIQHRAVLEANQHVIRKTKLELKAIKDEKAHNQSEVYEDMHLLRCSLYCLDVVYSKSWSRESSIT